MEEMSKCEKMVMSVIWDAQKKGVELDLKGTMDALKRKFAKEWKSQTVSTFLARLRKKGYLNARREGRYSYYSPLVEKDKFLERETLEMLRMFRTDEMEENTDMDEFEEVKVAFSEAVKLDKKVLRENIEDGKVD